MNKFWNWIRNDAGERILRLEGPIDEDNFWGDEITPKAFREELEEDEGDVTVYINSPGGNVFAAAEIYTMLLEHKGNVTVKIDAIAASAASVIAMAGSKVLMSPVAMLMIHDPMTIAMGNAKDMEAAINTLNEVKESIINAYHLKSGLNRKKISQLMEDQTWMNAKKAVELGFADGIITKDERKAEGTEGEEDHGKEVEAVWQPFSTKAMGQRVLNRIVSACEKPAVADEESVEAEGDPADVEPSETGVSGMFEEAIGETEPLEETAETELAESCETDTAAGEPVPEQAEAGVFGPQPAAGTVPEQVQEPDSESAEDTASVQATPVADETLPVVEDEKLKVPVIGMDGKTEDGAMPYELLRKQLDFLK